MSKLNITGYRFTLQWALALLLVSSMLILAACPNYAEPAPTVQATAAPTVEPAPMVQATAAATDEPTPTVQATVAPTVTPQPTPEPLTEDIPPCTPVPGSNVDPCEVGILGGPVTNQAASYDFGTEPTSVRFHLGSDSSEGYSAVHLVVRSTYLPGTLRCEATRIFPEEGGGVEVGIGDLRCYVGVRANQYIVGSGPATLTVLIYDAHHYSYATQDQIKTLLNSMERVFIEGLPGGTGLAPEGGIIGRETILFLAPELDAEIDVWEVADEWDVQQREDDTVIAVHPHREFWKSHANYQTWLPRLEMTLPAFT